MADLRLSEAIRLGSMLRQQGHGYLLTHDNETCALGAACEAVGVSIRAGQTIPSNAVFRRWPLLRLRVKSPVTLQGPTSASVSVIIQSLNDHLQWTRERIADWVETIEAKQAADPAASELTTTESVSR